MPDYLRTGIDPGRLYFWRDKSDREIDFVIRRAADSVDAVECKYNPDHLDPTPMRTFRSLYPKGKNYLVSPLVKMPCGRQLGGLAVSCIGFKELPNLF